MSEAILQKLNVIKIVFIFARLLISKACTLLSKYKCVRSSKNIDWSFRKFSLYVLKSLLAQRTLFACSLFIFFIKRISPSWIKYKKKKTSRNYNTKFLHKFLFMRDSNLKKGKVFLQTKLNLCFVVNKKSVWYIYFILFWIYFFLSKN